MPQPAPATIAVKLTPTVVAVGLDLEVPFERIQQALAGFAGVQRRFQVEPRQPVRLDRDGIIGAIDGKRAPATSPSPTSSGR